MNDISGRLCRSGWLITIAAVLTPAWDRAFPVRRAIANDYQDGVREYGDLISHHPRVAIRFRPAIASSLNVLGGLHHEYRLEPIAA
jgi:hypothetical protein